MSTSLTMGSLFDGIGGFPLAGSRQGFTPLWASEIEPFPIRVTKLHFSNMIHVGDITQLNGANLPPVDVVCGGSPCQDLSTAGKRAGLQGARSGLFMEQIRVIKEMRAHDAGTGRTADAVRPRYMVWENVPGAFSSADGEDFRIVLEETCRIVDGAISVPRPPGGVWYVAGCIMGDQFSLAWRIYDAQYWGLAQRRKRVYLVADFGDCTAPEILFEQDRLFGDPAPGEETWERPPAGAANGSGDSGRDPVNIGADSSLVAFACNQRDEVRNLHNVSGAIQAQPGMKQQTFIAHPSKETQTSNCLTPWDTQQKRIFTEKSVAPTLAGMDGNGGRNPGGLLLSAGVISKGNGECFLTPEQHTALSSGGGQAGQGYPCVLTAAFSTGAGAAAGGIGYREECAPTLKATEGGNMVPGVLCLNDQGGSRIDLSGNLSGTLRAQEHGHTPLVMGEPELYENHGIDSRYTGPHGVAPTMSARYGTGGNNVPLISQPSEGVGSDLPTGQSYCIAGNIIDRQDHNGGNGIGVQPNISYTLNTADRHCVFSQQRSDEYTPNGVVSTQSARQYKDATDLVCDTDIAGINCRAGSENGDLCGTPQSHPGGGYSFNTLYPVRTGKLIRRLTPLECERLQGFPDHWTDIPGACDSARYKALGNSVAIPCVEHVLRGIAYFLLKTRNKKD
jgi:DNA (cytosine-5)-methyltransferase 1